MILIMPTNLISILLLSQWIPDLEIEYNLKKRMHSSRMRTTRSLPSDRDPPGQRPPDRDPLDRDPPVM